MGYERNDRRDYRYEGFDRGRGRDRYDDANERGFFDRAGDEVRSWFGDEEAERRRRMDERYDERYDAGERSRYATYAPGGYRGPDYPRFERSNRDEGRARGSYARGYAPYSTYYPSAGEDRQFADQPVDTGYGLGDYGAAGYNYNEGARRREDEYRAAYGRGVQNDPHGYHGWRNRQIDSFDRDYDEYRRENQSRFDSEFSTWRQNRQTQRDSLRTAQEHQEVVGSDGQHVGKVDHVRGDRILLTKSDKDAGGHHHSIPSSWITKVDEKVHLTKTAEEAKRAWRDADERGGLFGSGDEREGGRETGRTNLNRSFSGTY